MATRNKTEYADKLLDPRWQRKRLEIFERDNWKCRNCGSQDRTLHAHHRIYRDIDPWDYPMDELVTLCAYCHEYETFNRKGKEDELVNIMRKHMSIYDIETLSSIMIDLPKIVSMHKLLRRTQSLVCLEDLKMARDEDVKWLAELFPASKIHRVKVQDGKI